MAGDAVNIWGKSYHKMPSGGYNSSTNPLSVLDLMTLLATSPTASGKGITGGQIAGLPGFPTNVTNLLNNQPPQNSNRPRASINWVILDEQFKYVSGGFDMVETATNTNGSFKDHSIQGIAIPKNGYIYVYCSNESQYPVFFDNLQLVHDRGPILEETHYYPFGLIMDGISSKAIGKLENKKKYNGIEFENDFDLNTYDAFFRELDPQTGRWWQLDPKPDNSQSLYSSMGNNPITYNDPLGDTLGINFFSNDPAPVLRNAASSLSNGKNDGVFAVFGHATPNGISTGSKGDYVDIRTPAQFSAAMSKSVYGKEWDVAIAANKKITIILYGCNCASNEYYDIFHGQGNVLTKTPFAEKLARSNDKFIVIGTDGYLTFNQRKDGKTFIEGIQQTKNNERVDTYKGAFVIYFTIKGKLKISKKPMPMPSLSKKVKASKSK